MPGKVKLTQVFSLKPVQESKGNREKPKISSADRLQMKSMLWPVIPRGGSAAAA